MPASTNNSITVYLLEREELLQNPLIVIVKGLASCDVWVLIFNASKVVSRSHTIHPQSATLTLGRNVLKESDDLIILGVTFDVKMAFEKHLFYVSRVQLRVLVS